MVTDWFPERSHFDTHEQWDAHVQTLKKVYQLRDDLNAKIQELQQATSNIRRSQTGLESGGPTNTKISGFLVKATTPTNGQTLKFNAVTGQVEWQ